MESVAKSSETLICCCVYRDSEREGRGHRVIASHRARESARAKARMGVGHDVPCTRARAGSSSAAASTEFVCFAASTGSRDHRRHDGPIDSER